MLKFKTREYHRSNIVQNQLILLIIGTENFKYKINTDGGWNNDDK